MASYRNYAKRWLILKTLSLSQHRQRALLAQPGVLVYVAVNSVIHKVLSPSPKMFSLLRQTELEYTRLAFLFILRSSIWRPGSPRWKRPWEHLLSKSLLRLGEKNCPSLLSPWILPPQKYPRAATFLADTPDVGLLISSHCRRMKQEWKEPQAKVTNQSGRNHNPRSFSWLLKRKSRTSVGGRGAEGWEEGRQ